MLGTGHDRSLLGRSGHWPMVVPGLPEPPLDPKRPIRDQFCCDAQRSVGSRPTLWRTVCADFVRASRTQASSRARTAIVYRWAENQINRLPALAAELVRRQVAVLVATGGPSSALTATSGLVRALMIASTEGLMALLAWMQTVQRNQPR